MRLIPIVCALAGACLGGVPVRWTAETSRVQPQMLEAWRGDTLDLECSLTSYGRPMSLGAATASFMWQTNGMADAWWQTNATVSADGVVRATWSPAMDPGGAEVAFFLPVQTAGGASYRAAGRIRFRPSPGAGSQTVALPPPGGTLDFGEFELVNAPWATLDAANAAIEAAVTSATGALVIPPAVDLGPYATTGYVAGAITSATGAIVIPPPVDLGPYATTGLVAEAVQASGNALAAQINAVSNAAMQRAEMGGYATVQQLADAIAGIFIPSLDGYATQSWVADYVASNAPRVNLGGYATQAYADAAASNALAQAEAQIPSLVGYATQDWVSDYVASNTPPVDLSSYASRSYADAAASNAQATAIAAIPNLAGYATQSYVADYFATNYTPPDLSSYASRSYADAAASNAQATAIAAIPSLDGYPTQQQMVDYVDDRMAQGVTVQVSTTRLETPDGLIWQDATGVVWQAEAIIGWYGEIWTNNAAYSPTSTGVTMAVTFAPAGPNAWTNALFGTITNVYFEGGAMMAWYTPAGVQHADNISPLDSTNLTFNLLYPENWDALGTNVYASLSLLRGPIGISATNAIRQVAYTDSPVPPPPGGVSDRIDDGTNTIYASRDVYRSVATNYYTAWAWSISPQTNAEITIYWGPDSPYAEGAGLTAQWYFDVALGGGGGPYNALGGDQTSTNLVFVSSFGTSTDFTVTFTRDQVSTNANQFVGILALTNNIAEAISTNNAAFVAAVTNCPVAIAAADGVTLGEFGEYGTLGSLLAALAAAITWLKTNKANKTDLPYPFVPATVTQEGPQLPASAFPIAGSYNGTAFSLEESDITIVENESTGDWMVLAYSGSLTICVYTSAGAFSASGTDITNLTFGGSSTAPSMEFPNVLTVSPRTVATYTAGTTAAAFEVAVGAGTTGAARDCVLVVDCTAAGAVAPTVTWPHNFHPRTDAEEIAPVAGVRNVFYISEYAPSEFVVGGWHEEVA